MSPWGCMEPHLGVGCTVAGAGERMSPWECTDPHLGVVEHHVAGAGERMSPMGVRSLTLTWVWAVPWQALVNALYRGKSARDAVGLPRIHHQLAPNTVRAEDWRAIEGGGAQREARRVQQREARSVEKREARSVEQGLRARGHKVEFARRVGSVQLVLQDTDTRELHAASDRRKNGRQTGASPVNEQACALWTGAGETGV